MTRPPPNNFLQTTGKGRDSTSSSIFQDAEACWELSPELLLQMCRVFTLLLHHSLLYCRDTAAEKGSEGCREACPPPRTGEGLPRSWKTPPTLHTCSLPFRPRAGGCGASSAEAPAWGIAFFQLLYNFKIYWCSRSSDICGMTQCRAPENLKSLNLCIKCPKFTSNGFIFIIMSGVYSTPV